jgi:succinoglycan biosynthesis protein ExoO
VTAPTAPPSPDVSVVIAAYDAADFIGRAVASALAQAGPTLEVLVIDDASTDATCAQVERLAERDPRIRLIRRARNGGPSAARNAGIDVARGRWVAVLDADDAYLPGRLDRLVQLAGARAADVVADNYASYALHEDRVGEPALAPGPVEALDAHVLAARCRPFGEEPDYGLLKPMFNRAFLDRERLRYPEDVRHGEDFLMVFHAALRGARYSLCRDVGYLYTARDSGRSRTKTSYRAQADAALGLSRLPFVAGDPALARLLRRRSQALRRLEAERRVAAAWRERALGRLARIALTDARGALEIVRRLKSRAARFAA